MRRLHLHRATQEGVVVDRVHALQQRVRRGLLVLHRRRLDGRGAAAEERLQLVGSFALDLLVDDYASATSHAPTVVLRLLGTDGAVAVAREAAEITAINGMREDVLEAVLLDDVEEDVLVAGTGNAPVDQHVGLGSVHVLEDAARVGDD